jgi:hypothetical protein
MSQITGGKVTYGRTVQPAQYESKKAEVEISFVIGEGEDIGDMLDRAAAMAEGKALELVGLRKAISPPVAAVSPQPTPKTNDSKTPDELKAMHAATMQVEPRRRVGRPPNPDKAKPEAAEEKPDAADMIDVDAPTTLSPQQEAINKAKAKVEAAQKAADDAAAAELAGMLDEAPAEEPITDKQLIEKIGHKNKSLMDNNAGIPQPRKIKELIAKYATHAHSIPPDKRKDFLGKLEELA